MGDFWEKNKGSIKSGLVTAGKYGYQGTKYVTKTGYHMAKNQYDAHKGKGHNNNTNANQAAGGHEAVSIDRLTDPKNFPAPPLRKGQKQYVGNGQTVCAEEAPIVNTPSGSQNINQLAANMGNQYQNQSQQNYVNYQYNITGDMPPPIYQKQQTLPQIMPQNATSQGSNSPYVTQYNEPSIPPQSQTSITMIQSNLQNQQLENIPQQTQYIQPASQVGQQPLQNEIRRPAPALPSGPPLPARPQTNTFESVESTNSTPSSIGPHFEVRPFNREEYEEKKKQKITILPQIDLSQMAPPPTHKDRSSNESLTKNSSSATIMHSQKGALLKYSTNSIASSSPDASSMEPMNNVIPSNTAIGENPKPLTKPDNFVKNLEQNEKEKEEINYTVSGTYHEPVTNFAPPPQPHRQVNGERNNPINNGHSSKVYTSTLVSDDQLACKPPPLLPQRNANNTLKRDSSQDVEYKLDENSLGNDNLQTNNSITGTYTERNVNFQPPPKPHKRSSNTPENREFIRRSPPGYCETTPAPKLPVRHVQSTITSRDTINMAYPESGNKQEPLISSGVYPVTEFAPPPKPFRPVSSKNNLNDKIGSMKINNANELNHDNHSIEPSRARIIPDHNDTNNLSNKLTEETSSVSHSPVNSNLPIGSSDTFIQELNSSIANLSIHGTSKHKGTPPPVVKPKPKSLNNISLERKSSVSTSKNHSEINKKKPPVIKPKPRNLENLLKKGGIADNSSVNNYEVDTSETNLDHSQIEKISIESNHNHSSLARRQPPIPPSRRAQPPVPPTVRKQPPIPNCNNDIFISTNRRAKMPLPNEIDNSSKDNMDSKSNDDDDDDDVNPFAIYKKDAVPASPDRIHNV